MKLWTTIEFEKLPGILKNGFDNPYAAEIVFSNNPEIEADHAMSMQGELAFIEADVPDDKLDFYFMDCIGMWGDDLSNMETDLDYLIEEGAHKKEIDHLRKLIKKGSEARTVTEGLDVFGYACLGNVIPPEMLKLLDPEKMIEAVHTGDENAIASAIETSEATPFKSLNAAFWVWLITIMSQIFGAGYGMQASETEEIVRGEAEQAEEIRKAAAKRPRKKRKRKTPAKTKGE
jgi:hypothetical protein